MYKILIADDEKKVCQLIQLLGDWDRLQIQIAAVCNDGSQALEQICALQPDIVLTDIRMPGYDGLALIEQARQRGLDCSFIILSGYRQFDYARSAMQLGITDYLLKPIDQEQLNATLEKVCRRIDERRQASADSDQAHRIIKESESRRQCQLMQRLLGGQPLTPAQAAQGYGVNLGPGPYQALLLNTGLAALHGEEQGFGEKVAEAVRRVFPDAGCRLALSTPDGVYCLIGCAGLAAEPLRGRVRELYYEVKTLEEVYGALQLALGAAEPVFDPLQLPAALQQARLAERTRIFGAPSPVLFAQLLPPMPPPPPQLAAAELQALAQGLEAFSTPRVEAAFRSLEKLFLSFGPSRTLWVWRLRNLVLEQLQALLSATGQQDAGPRLEALRLETDRAGSCLLLNNRLRGAACGLLQTLEAERQNRESRPIQKAKQYIQQHYSEPLTLEEVAAHTGFSPTYFSTVFKKHTGENFSDHLMQVRMEAAKGLLRSSELGVGQIAAAVGYGDDKYFRKLFKKQMGMKPSEYRKLYFL